jgi:hypothetical protein
MTSTDQWVVNEVGKEHVTTLVTVPHDQHIKNRGGWCTAMCAAHDAYDLTTLKWNQLETEANFELAWLDYNNPDDPKDFDVIRKQMTARRRGVADEVEEVQRDHPSA